MADEVETCSGLRLCLCMSMSTRDGDGATVVMLDWSVVLSRVLRSGGPAAVMRLHCVCVAAWQCVAIRRDTSRYVALRCDGWRCVAF